MKAALLKFQQTPTGQLAISFLWLCLMFRAAIPAGFMPVLAGQSDAGGSLVQLCHGDSGSAQLLDMLETVNDLPPSSHSAAKHEQCAFSAFTLLAIPGVAIFNFDFFLAETLSFYQLPIFATSSYSSHPARAPPFFASLLI